MPAQTPLPSIQQFLDAYAATLRGQNGPRINARRGGTYDLAGGSAAVLWAQQVRRDQDNFRQVYPDTATGEDADRLIERRYSITRVLESFGAGAVLLQRPTAAAGADTIYTGTRFTVRPPDGGLPVPYAASVDTPVGAADLSVVVPIRATRPGPGVAVESDEVALGDALFDATLLPVHLACGEGTLRESEADFLARGREARRLSRIGYADSVERVCIEAGAANVVVLDANAFGDEADFGVTHVYVADQGFATSTTLLDACALAVERARVEGCDMQVLGMETTPIGITVAVTLWDDTGKFNLPELRRIIAGALIAAFNRRPSFWLFSLDSLSGETIAAAVNAVQTLTLTSTIDPPVPGFFDVLPRYTLAPSAVSVSFVGPS